MKIISMYLPQFHRVKENDEWWGEGYTDWISAKNAVPIFDGHYQPHIPLNRYYYDLTQKEALTWQASLMKKYGIDAQCIYHYWFNDGKQILEKPVENLLRWTDIDMPFCLCWANQSWVNSWSAIRGANVWCDAREQVKKDSSDNGILLEQKYGDQEEWIKHFSYLNSFFKDPRYLKLDNKPVFVIYQAQDIDVLEEMVNCWNVLAVKEGFDGVYFIGVGNKDERTVNAVLYPGPQTAFSRMLESAEYKQGVRVLDYSDVWENILQHAALEENALAGAFVGYDDTPRRGKKGCSVIQSSPQLFERYLGKLLAINELHNQPFTFINAWNEWGEGMHLEPDEKYKMAYLEAVRRSRENYSTKISEMKQYVQNVRDTEMKNRIKVYKETVFRYKSYWTILDKWLELKTSNISIGDILEKMGIKKIVVYGMGMLGRHLVADLQESSVKIISAIDRKKVNGEYTFPITDNMFEEPTADAIIVTPIYEYSHIKAKLEKYGWKNIISLEKLLCK